MGNVKQRSAQSPQVPEDYFPIEIKDFSGGMVSEDYATDFVHFADLTNLDLNAAKKLVKRPGIQNLMGTGWANGTVNGFHIYTGINSVTPSQNQQVLAVNNGTLYAGTYIPGTNITMNAKGSIAPSAAGNWSFANALLGSQAYAIGCNNNQQYLISYDGAAIGTITTTGHYFTNCTYAYGRIFLTGDHSQPHLIYYSNYLDPLTYDDDGAVATAFTDDFISIPEEGGEIRVLTPYSNYILVIREQGIQRLQGKNPTDFSIEPFLVGFGTAANLAVTTYQDKTFIINNIGGFLLNIPPVDLSEKSNSLLYTDEAASGVPRSLIGCMTNDDIFVGKNNSGGACDLPVYSLIRSQPGSINFWRMYNFPGTLSTIYGMAFSNALNTPYPLLCMSINGTTNIFEFSQNLYSDKIPGTNVISCTAKWSENAFVDNRHIWKKLNCIRVLGSGKVYAGFTIDGSIAPATQNGTMAYKEYYSYLGREYNGHMFSIQVSNIATDDEYFRIDSVLIEGQQKGTYK